MVELRIEGEKELFAGLEKIQSRSHRADLMDQIGAYGVASTQDRFLNEESPSGEKWEKSYRVEQEGGSILRDSNQLFQSLTHEQDPDSVAWGSNKIYAGIHQFGGEIIPKNKEKLAFNVGGNLVFADKVTMPQREYLGLSADDRTEIRHIIDDWLSEALQ